MAFTSSKVPSGSVVTKNVGNSRPPGKIYPISRGFERRRLRNTPLLLAKLSFPNERWGSIYEKTGGFAVTRGSSVICFSRTRNSETAESVEPCTDCPDASGWQKMKLVIQACLGEKCTQFKDWLKLVDMHAMMQSL